MPFTITPTDVINEYGSYYINSGQNMQSLLLRPFEAFGTREAFTNVPTEDTQLRYSDVQVGEILQPYQDAFTAKGNVTFKPVTINLKPVKIDVSFNPQNLVYSWLGFLTSTSVDRTEWPFTRWVIEIYLLKQLFADLEEKVIYKGVFAAHVANTAGAAGITMDGAEKVINNGITATRIVPILIGAPSTDPVTWCTQVETFAKGLPEKYWEVAMTINMSRVLAKRYAEGKKAKYNMNYAQEADLFTVAGFETLRVKGRASMQGKTKIWATPLENAVFATKGFANANGFEIEKEKRNVHIFTDFHIGLGYLLEDLVFTSDSNLPA
ncbi:MAG: YceI family protein [Sphingobacteriales bacterium]|nr:MAG: YceI family protein [Sphingobacteriales bacterium]